VYQNETEVGSAVHESGVQRGAIFLTSKLKPHDQGYAPARLAFERTCGALAVEYLDLFLIHWPGTAKTPLTADANAVNRHESWRALQELQASGRIHAIGVSNFEISHLEALRLAPTTTVKPAVNQIELHPRLYIAQKPLLDYCASHGIVVQAYASLGTGSLLADPDIVAVAQRTGLSEAAVLLLWAVGHGFAVIPRSTDPSRIAANRAAVEQARSAPVLAKPVLPHHL
jgi:diketogulonate reductase-like aldo/keto reductase